MEVCSQLRPLPKSNVCYQVNTKSFHMFLFLVISSVVILFRNLKRVSFSSAFVAYAFHWIKTPKRSRDLIKIVVRYISYCCPENTVVRRSTPVSNRQGLKVCFNQYTRERMFLECKTYRQTRTYLDILRQEILGRK